MTWTLDMPMREEGQSRKRKWAQAGRWEDFYHTSWGKDETSQPVKDGCEMGNHRGRLAGGGTRKEG